MRRWLYLLPILVACGAAAQTVTDDNVAEFYRGKALNIVVGHEAGTGYDFFGRTLSRHITRHLPGNPNAVPQNMPGAGGLRAANWLYNVAAKDGTVVSVLAPETALEADLRRRGRELRAGQIHLDRQHGREHRDLHGLRPLRDHLGRRLFTREAVFGATGIAAPTSKFAYALVNFLGARIKVVQGYKGSNDLRIALNRGEIEGACGPSHSTLKTQWKDDIDSGRIRVLVQFGLKKLPDLKDAAHIYDYAKSNEDREVFDVAFGPHVLGRPVIAPPGVPADRANALRAAFMRTMQDAELLAETSKLGLEIRPSSGKEVEALVRASPRFRRA